MCSKISKKCWLWSNLENVQNTFNMSLLKMPKKSFWVPDEFLINFLCLSKRPQVLVTTRPLSNNLMIGNIGNKPTFIAKTKQEVLDVTFEKHSGYLGCFFEVTLKNVWDIKTTPDILNYLVKTDDSSTSSCQESLILLMHTFFLAALKNRDKMNELISPYIIA